MKRRSGSRPDQRSATWAVPKLRGALKTRLPRGPRRKFVQAPPGPRRRRTARHRSPGTSGRARLVERRRRAQPRRQSKHTLTSTLSPRLRSVPFPRCSPTPEIQPARVPRGRGDAAAATLDISRGRHGRTSSATLCRGPRPRGVDATRLGRSRGARDLKKLVALGPSHKGSQALRDRARRFAAGVRGRVSRRGARAAFRGHGRGVDRTAAHEPAPVVRHVPARDAAGRLSEQSTRGSLVRSARRARRARYSVVRPAPAPALPDVEGRHAGRHQEPDDNFFVDVGPVEVPVSARGRDVGAVAAARIVSWRPDHRAIHVWAGVDATPRRRNARTIGRSTSQPRRRRDSSCPEYPRRSRGVAATRLRNIRAAEVLLDFVIVAE